MSRDHFAASHNRIGDNSTFRQGHDFHGPVTIVSNELEQIASQRPAAQLPLNDAVAEGNEIKIEKLLKAGADINAYDAEGYTPLNRAIWNANNCMVNFLLEKGAVVENHGPTLPALHAAVINGNKPVAETLLDRGADIEKRSSGETPLAVAAAKGNEALVALFLERGAKVDSRNLHGRTPLYGAVKGQNTEIVKMLLQHSANLSEGDYSGMILVHIYRHAALLPVFLMFGNDQIREKLEAKELADALGRIKRAKFDIENHDGDKDRALVYFANAGYERETAVLLKKGANTSAKDRGATALYKAVERGHPRIVRLLLDAGADLSIVYPPTRETILHVAIKQTNVAVVEMLLKHGADPNTKNAGGNTPLHYEAIFGSETIAVLLLDSGADIEAKDNSGVTALSRAGYLSAEEVVRALRDRGASSAK